MTTQVLTGLLLLVLPVAYNGLYTLVARGFDYPDILRRPTGSEPRGWKLAGTILPLAYIGWSAWLLVLGIAFLIS
jgi:hypothetical protein